MKYWFIALEQKQPRNCDTKSQSHVDVRHKTNRTRKLISISLHSSNTILLHWQTHSSLLCIKTPYKSAAVGRHQWLYCCSKRKLDCSLFCFFQFNLSLPFSVSPFGSHHTSRRQELPLYFPSYDASTKSLSSSSFCCSDQSPRFPIFFCLSFHLLTTFAFALLLHFGYREAQGYGSLPSSVTRKKSPNVYKSCLKIISLEK